MVFEASFLLPWILGLFALLNPPLGTLVLNAAEPSEETPAIVGLIAGRCLECHGTKDSAGGLDLSSRSGLAQGSDSGAVIEQAWESSILWRVIRDGEMPPKGKLTPDEKESLRNWIASGADLPEHPIDRLAISSSYRAGYDWWAFQPIRKEVAGKASIEPTSNGVNGKQEPNFIDELVEKKLAEQGLVQNEPAQPRSLIRRLFFDLIGLPPSAEDVRAFEANPSEEAYQALVERLLDSPAYGERWGRHWLDVVRYGESDGFERNFPRLHSWYYRDWVIQALNEDLPYDRFVEMQIAGDQLDPTLQGLAAAGFLVSGVHNTVVGSSDRMKRIALQDELEEKIGTMSQAFLGLTAQCARCHEHKFDPIDTESYYRLAAALKGVAHGEREIIDEEQRRIERGLEENRELVAAQLRELEQRVIRQVQTNAKNEDRGDTQTDRVPLPYAAWSFERTGDTAPNEAGPEANEEGLFYDSVRGLRAKWIGSKAALSKSRSGGGLVLDGQSYVESDPIDSDLSEKTLTAWVAVDPLDQSGGGVLSLQTTDGVIFDAIVYGERESRQWMAGSNGFSRSQSFQGAMESVTKAAGDNNTEDNNSQAKHGGDLSDRVHIAIRYRADGSIQAFRNGVPYGKPYKTGFQTYTAGKSQFLFGLRHGPAGGNRWLQGTIYRAACFDSALSDEAIAELAGTPLRSWDLEKAWGILGEEAIQSRDAYRRELARIDAELRDVRGSVRKKVYSVLSNGSIGTTHVLIRGDVYREGTEVLAGGITAIGKDAKGSDFGLTKESTDGERRRALAHWITHVNRELLSRVIVNRLWHHHFGAGIVETPNDFGFNGARPSHPELLDALAQQLIDGGMRLKGVHRWIVLSKTYKQSSRPREDGMRKDSGNRWLWRYPVRRLDGESARDAMLSIAGVLDPQMGGPGYIDVDYKDNNGTTYYLPKAEEPRECFRRTVYRFNPRCERSSLLDVLDCPDPSATAPKRSLTTTPLQALSLLNSSFVFQMSDALVDSIEAQWRTRKDGGAAQELGRDQWIELLFERVLLRAPTLLELEQSRSLVDKHGVRALARALWNSNEFLVLD